MPLKWIPRSKFKTPLGGTYPYRKCMGAPPPPPPGGGRGLCTHVRDMHDALRRPETRQRSSKNRCSWKWLFRVFLRNPICVCEVSNSFFSLKKFWGDLNLIRHHQSLHFSFAVTLQTLACHITPMFTASLNATCSVFTFVLFQVWLMKHRN